MQLASHIDLVGHVAARPPLQPLERGRQVALFAPVTVGDLLPAGTLLDDWLDRGAREAIDARAAACLAAWCERRRRLDELLGLPLLAIWEMELLADVFVASVRLVDGVLHMVEKQGVTSVELRGVARDASACLETLLRERDVAVANERPGSAPPPLLSAAQGPGGLPAKVIARTGLPAAARGHVVLWPYWHLDGVVEHMCSDACLRPVLDLLNLPLSLDVRRLVGALARGGWWARAGARARRRSQALVAAAVAQARAEAPAEDALGRLLDARALALLARRAGDTPAEHAAAMRTFRGRHVRCCLLPFDSPPDARTVAEAARAAGIPVVVVQHGAVYSDALQTDRTFADVAAVWSLEDARRIAGRARGVVVVTGNPGARLPDRSSRGVRRARTVVLVESVSRLSTTTDARMPLAHLETALRGLAAARRGAEVVVRPHPSERDLTGIERVTARHGERATVAAGGPIEPLLDGADLCVGAVSTATLQAGARGTPVIMLNVAHRTPPWPLDGTSDVPYVTSAEELAAAVPTALAAPEPQGAVAMREALGLRPPGEARDAVVALLRGVED